MSEQVNDRDGIQAPVPTRVLTCLIVVPSLIRAGAETQAVDLANGLAANGHAVHLCSFEPQLDQRMRISNEVQFHHLCRRSKFDISFTGRLAQIIDNESIDIILCVMEFATLIGWLASRRSARNPPVVAAVHTTINRGLKQELQERLLYRRLLRRLPAIIFVCDNQRTHWIKKYPDLTHLAKVVHNGVETGRFCKHHFVEPARQLRANLDIPEDVFVFACIAAFRPEKGHKHLIDAFSRVTGNPWLVFAGDGQLRTDIEDYATAVGVRDRTRFLGNVPDTRPVMAASNMTVLASTAVETFSMAMLESMAMGVPMIAPRIGGLPEAIIDGDTGLIFPMGDLSALARCMTRVVERPLEADRMGQRAERKVSKEFTQTKMIAGTEQVLSDVLDRIRSSLNLKN